MERAEPFVMRNLERLYNEIPSVDLMPEDRVVVFSDMHIGNGGKNDDYKHNAALFTAALERHYLPKGFKLVLNGDVEELQRFSYDSIRRAHPEFYDLIGSFRANSGLIKTFGNHDLKLVNIGDERLEFPVTEGIHINTKHGSVIIFHGHQASNYFVRYNRVSEVLLRGFANPLHIKNLSVSHSSVRQYRTERRVYSFSKDKRIVSIIGHTHRPLFESLSKYDSIRYGIEAALRKYVDASDKKKAQLEDQIRAYRSELDAHLSEGPKETLASQVYDSIVVPSVFNAGCVIGKRGITGIEITSNRIRLVYWFDEHVSTKYIKDVKRPAQRLAGTPYFRKVLKQDRLSYVFARIRLLS